MAKAPEERYGSAEELAEDRRAVSPGVPVVAREPSFGYVTAQARARDTRLRSSRRCGAARPHRRRYPALWQAAVATAERQRAEQRFGEVRQLANALISRFTTRSPRCGLDAGSSHDRGPGADIWSGWRRKRRAIRPCSSSSPCVRPNRHSAGCRGRQPGRREGAFVSFRRAQALVAPLTLTSTPGVEVVSGSSRRHAA